MGRKGRGTHLQLCRRLALHSNNHAVAGANANHGGALAHGLHGVLHLQQVAIGGENGAAWGEGGKGG